MKKMMVLLFAMALLFAVQVEARMNFVFSVGEKGVFHIRGFADDSSKVLVFVKTNLESFGIINSETEIKIGEEKKTAADLRSLEGKSVIAYGKRVDGILLSLTVIKLSEAEKKPNERPKISSSILERGFLETDSPKIGGQVWISTVGTDFRRTKRIKENLYLGRITNQTFIYINEQSAGQEELWRLRGNPDIQCIFCITEEDARKESEPKDATLPSRIVKEIRILIFE